MKKNGELQECFCHCHCASCEHCSSSSLFPYFLTLQLFVTIFGFFPILTLVITSDLGFFCNFPLLLAYISLSLYKTHLLNVGNTMSGRQLPRSFLSPLSFIFFSTFSAAKHFSEDDNSEDVRLDLFLLEEEGRWLGCRGNSRFLCF